MDTESLRETLPLGKAVAGGDRYRFDVLRTVPRSLNRAALGAGISFRGWDLWRHYEISYLNRRGRPEAAVGLIWVPAETACIVESKSLKLYFNGFAMTRFLDIRAAEDTARCDLARLLGPGVEVSLYTLREAEEVFRIGALDAVSLDDLDIAADTYAPEPAFLTQDENSPEVTEALCTDLLRSNCLITRQPDWGTLYVRYTGKKINREGLLRYVVSLRSHNEFHEHCVERIFADISRRCRVSYLEVRAFYTRRGGIDINPARATRDLPRVPVRLIRQ